MCLFLLAYSTIGLVIFLATMLLGGPRYSLDLDENGWLYKTVDDLFDSSVGGLFACLLTVVVLILIWPYHIRRTFQRK